jgi:hypothetical protein
MRSQNYTIGNYVVSDIFKTARGFPYVIKIKRIDDDFGVIEYDYEGETHYIGTDRLRIATKFEKFFGPIYDFLLK